MYGKTMSYANSFRRVMGLGKYGFFIYRKRPLWYTNDSKLDPDGLVKVILYQAYGNRF